MVTNSRNTIIIQGYFERADQAANCMKILKKSLPEQVTEIEFRSVE